MKFKNKRLRVHDIFYYLRLFRIVVSTNLLYIWVTWRGFYKKQELLILREDLSSPPVFGGVRVAHIFSFCVVLLCVFTFWLPCCDVRSDFRIKTMFGSCLPPVVCGMGRIFFTLFVLCCIWWCPTYIVLCFCFVCLCCVPYVARISVHVWLPSYI